jgi:cytochrome d ubiquinol oxidase subunit I
MVALGMLFVLVMGIGVLLALIKKLEQARWYLKILPWLIPLPLLACELGWIVAEMGRQPWVVYHVLKTADAYSFNVSAGEVLFSIILFSVIYVILGALYLFLLLRKVKAGPEEPSAKEAK